jgi:hypothetical protein
MGEEGVSYRTLQSAIANLKSAIVNTPFMVDDKALARCQLRFR